MGATISDRLSQLGYVKARRLLVLAGVLVLGVVALTMYARSVDTVEVVATLLFLPIFLAFVYRGVVGGVIGALVATGIYIALRSPARPNSRQRARREAAPRTVFHACGCSPDERAGDGIR